MSTRCAQVRELVVDAQRLACKRSPRRSPRRSLLLHRCASSWSMHSASLRSLRIESARPPRLHAPRSTAASPCEARGAASCGRESGAGAAAGAGAAPRRARCACMTITAKAPYRAEGGRRHRRRRCLPALQSPMEAGEGARRTRRLCGCRPACARHLAPARRPASSVRRPERTAPLQVQQLYTLRWIQIGQERGRRRDIDLSML